MYYQWYYVPQSGTSSNGMRITISGYPGAGKTTVGKLLADRLGYKFYSVGDLRGKMAMERGMTIDELNKLGEKEFWTDDMADQWQKKIGQTEDNFVIEGRLSFYFIPDSVKIFLTIDPTVAAERVFINQRPDEKPVSSAAEMKNLIQQRLEADRKRYQEYYHIDPSAAENFDLVIDTTSKSIDEVVEEIQSRLSKT